MNALAVHPCEHCGAMWSGPDDDAHAIHFRQGECGHMVQVNCTGKRVAWLCHCEQSTAPVVTLEWIDADIHRGFLGCQRCAGERLVPSPTVPEWESAVESFEAEHLFCAEARDA